MKLSKTRYLNSLSILSSFHTTSSYRQLPLKSKEMKRKKRGTWVLKKEKESVETLMYGKPTFGYSMKIWYTLYKNRPCILFYTCTSNPQVCQKHWSQHFCTWYFYGKEYCDGKAHFHSPLQYIPSPCPCILSEFSFKDFCYCMRYCTITT